MVQLYKLLIDETAIDKNNGDGLGPGTWWIISIMLNTECQQGHSLPLVNNPELSFLLVIDSDID